MAEGAVTLLDDGLEVFGGDFVARDVQRQDLEGEFFEGEVGPGGFPVGGEGWDRFGDEETAVRSEAFEDDFLEGELDVEDLLLATGENDLLRATTSVNHCSN